MFEELDLWIGEALGTHVVESYLTVNKACSMQTCTGGGPTGPGSYGCGPTETCVTYDTCEGQATCGLCTSDWHNCY